MPIQRLQHWTVLQRFWARALDPAFKSEQHGHMNFWREEVRALNHLGIAMETALQHLYFHRPHRDAFEQWMIEYGKENADAHADDAEPMMEDVLSADDLASWGKNGFLVLRNAVPTEQCRATQKAIWEFLQASPDDPASWYRDHDEKRGMMVRFFDHPALNANRESKQIRRAFQQLYASPEICRTIDKVSFNPPEHEAYRFMGSGLHWDASLVLPIPYRLQGLLYLTDCGADDGAFHCVPGFHHHIGTWLSSLPQGAQARELAPQQLKPVSVPGQCGDLVIWHQALPHCATPNHGVFPRMVQYLTYVPRSADEQSDWI
jgi:hypothetical protein